jgi:hypothetical protein
MFWFWLGELGAGLTQVDRPESITQALEERFNSGNDRFSCVRNLLRFSIGRRIA